MSTVLSPMVFLVAAQQLVHLVIENAIAAGDDPKLRFWIDRLLNTVLVEFDRQRVVEFTLIQGGFVLPLESPAPPEGSQPIFEHVFYGNLDPVLGKGWDSEALLRFFEAEVDRQLWALNH